jgi:quercetin dioxygenase-like cupin family protein|tara:strand:+ start:459 stop:869 length:411 start_codon:yes stop_codon:yes gene_type:complete
MRDHTLEAMPYKGEVHQKAWGHELWVINNEKYCGKLLVFKEGKSFSMHYHLLKDEAWYISKGEFQYTYIDTETSKHIKVIVKEGDCIHLMPGQPHQMLAIEEGSCIFEVSTQHFDSDSYRILPGASQKDNFNNLPF